MQIEVTSRGGRVSLQPVVAASALVVVVAVTFLTTFALLRSPAATQPTADASSLATERAALIEAGFTGRLGGVTPSDGSLAWAGPARDAGFTGRLGGATLPADWTQRAGEAGFTGRLGG